MYDHEWEKVQDQRTLARKEHGKIQSNQSNISEDLDSETKPDVHVERAATAIREAALAELRAKTKAATASAAAALLVAARLREKVHKRRAQKKRKLAVESLSNLATQEPHSHEDVQVKAHKQKSDAKAEEMTTQAAIQARKEAENA